MNRDIYEAITERFIEQLKRGTVPWQKPWFGVQNIVSRKPYSGVNSLLLGSTDYQSPFWLSFKQALDVGGHVRKGEKSTPVIYCKILENGTQPGTSSCGRTANQPAFPSSGGRMFSISTRPEESKLPRSPRTRTCHRRAKERQPS
jgi:antirestriction protein ArdC